MTEEHMMPVRRDLPSGTVTLLFTDVERSTKLLHELGAEAYADALDEHRRRLRAAFARHGGVEVDTQGDAFFYAFPTARAALEAAQEGGEALFAGPIRVRIGIHTGTPHLTDEGYVGPDVHKAARIAAAGHGGQVLLSKATRDLVTIDVVDLGEHRLKDFTEPVWIFQLGKKRFPPLKTISNTNLPRPASSFIGREREVREVIALLRDGARLLTLTGPGGSGKTRLAIEAAADLVPEFKNGVFWVGLASLRDPALVTEAISRTLGARDGLGDYIAQRELLLLLDNFEQVVDAAPALSALLAVCPNLRLVVTSRERLRVQGEVEYAVPPLAESEAVQLFAARSRLKADSTVAELCRRLDNLPLAVELAAARTSLLSPAQILERLAQRLDLLKGGRDAEARQRTLRATIAWSFDLLSEAEKTLFTRLSVFAGGGTLEAAQEVAKADLDTLQSLVDKSLLRHTDERFWMLETIREYAAERVAASGEAEAVWRRHAEHFLALAEEGAPHLRAEVAGSPRQWLNRLELEHDNIRAALDWFAASGEHGLVLRLAAAVAEFWGMDHVAEGRRRLESALHADTRPTAARARALNESAGMAVISGDPAAGRLLAEEALALHRTLGDAWGTADSLWQLGYATAEQGDWAQAQLLLQESVRLFQDVGDQHSTVWATRTLAWVYLELGDRGRARAVHEDNLRRARALGNQLLEATLLGALAMLAVDEGRVEDARPMLIENTRLLRRLDDRRDLVENLCRVARALASAGRAGAAARLLACGEALFQEMGVSVPWVTRMNRETLTAVRAQLDEAAFAEASEQGRALTADAAVALALDSLK